MDAGSLLTLTAPTGAKYQWKQDGVLIPGAENQTLVFNPVEEKDSGVYTVTCDNGAKAIVTSPPFNLIVKPEGTVPVAGLAGLVLLACGCALGGARSMTKRRN